MEYIALGTSASYPTSAMGAPSGLLVRGNQSILLDCGEGTSHQLARAKRPIQKISYIWISHSHLDHYLGVAGIAWYLDLLKAKEAIKIFADSSTLNNVKTLLELSRLKQFNPSLISVAPGIFYEDVSFVLRAFELRHTIPCFGLALEENPSKHFQPELADKFGIPHGPDRKALQKGETITLKNGKEIKPEMVLGPPTPGKKVVYIADTLFHDSLISECEKADLLICEATYLERDINLALKYQHMTVTQASLLAREAKVRNLLLTHLSPRYELVDIENEATNIFSKTLIARDLQEYQIDSFLPRNST